MATTYIDQRGVDTATDGLPPWPQTLPEQTTLQESVHERHWAARHKIILALEDSYSNHHHRAATSLALCSNGASFYIDPTVGKVKPWVSRCHHRMCLYCGIARSAKVAEQIHLVINRMKQPRLVILTVPSVDRPLHAQLAHLRRSFRRLRARKAWKSLVTGGIYTIEVTRHKRTGLWHPHLNAIIDGTFFPQKLLRSLWNDVTGDAQIVWVSQVRDRAGAARELSKYVGKPQQVAPWPPEVIRNYADAVAGNRMVQTFGNVYGLKVEDRDLPDTESPATYQIKISRLVHLARLGADTPSKLLVLIGDRWPQFRSYIYHLIPKLERPKSAGDQMRRLRRLLDGRAPPNTPAQGKTANTEKIDAAIFIAFTRFRADEKAEVFLDFEFRPQETLPWT